MPTLSTKLILQDTLKAYRVLFPMLGAMGREFNEKPLRLDDQVVAHIRVLPTSAAYDPVTGYANGATQGRSLLVDVPITVDKHRHVPLQWSHLDLIKDQKETYSEAIADAAFVLGREMVMSVLAKANASNISGEKVEASADVDLQTLTEINGAMNIRGASPNRRIGIVSTEVANALELDTRIGSKDYYGIQTGGNAYRVFRNVAGFQAIYEFPALDENNAATREVTATAATDLINLAAHGFANGSRVRFTTTTTLPAPLAANTTYYVVSATADTFKVAATDGGAAINITDAGTGTHSVVGWEKLTGFFFEQSAVALRAGIPEQTAEAAAALGILQVMGMEVMKDPQSGFTVALMKWQQGGTGHLFVSPTSVWGSSVGRQGGASGAITDRGGYRLVSAA